LISCWRVLLLLVPILPIGVARASEPDKPDHVVLRSGKILTGRVVGSMKVEKAHLLQIETDFGQILVPRKEVKKRVEARGSRGVFQIREIRVVQWRGTVERRLAGGEQWRPIDETDRYADNSTNAPNAVVQPGDTIRTGPGSTIDLMPHKDVWIRIAPNSEVEIPQQRQEGTIKLHRGKTIQRVTGEPRGDVFRVRTQSSVVDHMFVLGGEDSFFSLETGASGDRVTVRSGAVRVNGSDVVKAGQAKEGAASARAAEVAEIHVLSAHTPRFPVDDYVYVAPGTYAVGGDPYLYNEDGVRTTRSKYGTDGFTVVLDGYLIDRREVAAEEFYDFVCANRPRLGAGHEYAAPVPKRARWPVVHQNWETAKLFAAWAGKELPTEAQWEVAAHGGTDRRHPWGDKFGPEHRKLGRGRWGRLWLPAKVFDPVDAPTVDVSILGVRAMSTNAAEWCRDDWRMSPFHEHMLTPPECRGKVVRGTLGHMRVRWCLPARSVGENIPGFRCVVELK
jgi:formylglycine-generating enzyme required for sulfatase activity